MKEEVVAVVLLFLKVYICKAENVIVGSTKQLVCQLQNGNVWQKYNDGSSFWETINNGGRYSGSNSGILTITDFQIKESGNFRCKVDGTVSTGNVIALQPEVQASIGSSVTLTCTVSGAPLYWYVIGNNGARALTDNNEYEGTTTNYLKIKSLTANTAGVYYCWPQYVTKGPDITVSISVDGEWSSWNHWEHCNVINGTGEQRRRRHCNNPTPANGGNSCQGEEYDHKSCEVDGGWSSWISWGACTVTCGTGQQVRRRYCNSPAPANNGVYCQGEEYDYYSCTLSACPVDGEWSSWNHWEHCNVTNGTGQQGRRRNCINPTPANGGNSCQGEEYDHKSCEEQELQQSGNIQIAVGTVCAVLVIVLVMTVVVIYAKRRWYNSKKEPDYEITDMTRVKAHIYGETHVNHTYQNDQHSAEIEVTVAENQYIDGAHLVERYDVSDLTNRYRNKDYFLQRLRAEFKLLNDSTADPKPLNSQYEIVDTGLRQDVNQLNLNSSTLNVLYNNKVSILLEVPQQNLAEQFWTIIDDHCIETIILLVNENEKMTEFYPTIDDVFRMNNFEIYLESAERKNKNIKLLTFNLENKTTQSMRQIKIFKTNVLESPPVKGICFILDKASESRGASVLIINSKMADLSVCGVLTVCLNVIYSIKSGSFFSVLENAVVVNKNDRGFFKNFADYALCYKVIEHYIEAVHTYDFIE